MRQFYLFLALVVGICIVQPIDVEAGGWGRRLSRRPSLRATSPQYRYGMPFRYSYPTASELYPKYYGSFHYRHLDNIGVPTGDIGIRGNGLYMSPW